MHRFLPSVPLRPRGLAASLVAFLAVLAVASASPADVVDTLWIDPDNFQYRVIHMPDLDQRRLVTESIPGLPNNGAMYCAPASAMNVLAYIANHGFPTVPPEQHYWSDPDTYNVATGSMLIFGLLMNTSPTGGTGWDGVENGLQALLPLDKFTYKMYIADNTYTPRFKEMAQTAFNGSLIQLCHGWYVETADDGGTPVITRNGGHCLTMTRAYAGFFSDSLYVRDPADDPANTSQSPFVERIYEVENRSVVADGISRTMSNLQVTPGVWSNRYLDGFCAIRPKAGYTFTDIGIIYFAAYDYFGDPGPVEITIEALGEVTDIFIGPDDNNLYYIGRAGSNYRLYCANLQTRESVDVGLAPVSIAPCLTVGRRRGIYHVSGRTLTQVDLEDPVKSSRVTMPLTADAATYNDNSDEVAIIDLSARLFMVYPYYLGTPTTYTLPGGQVIPPGTPRALAWDPVRDSYWLTLDTSDDVFQLKRVGPNWQVTRLSHEAITRPTSVDVDDTGHVFVVADCLLEFEEIDGVWTLVEDSPFSKRPSGPVARVTKCRTNYDPLLHDGTRWRNVLPTSFAPAQPDCAADLNLSGAVEFGDILEVITSWGPCPPDDYCAEDLDFSGAVDFGDLIAVITAWGVCP